ncbi:MAG: hypothetical protein ACI854_002593 [Arenicella sp.]|jgi:hypothetical protein
MSNSPRFINDKRFFNTNDLSADSLALVVKKVTPIPASIINKADARPSNIPAKFINNELPISAFMATLKLTMTIPNIANALARSKPVTLCFIEVPITDVVAGLVFCLDYPMPALSI